MTPQNGNSKPKRRGNRGGKKRGNNSPPTNTPPQARIETPNDNNSKTPKGILSSGADKKSIPSKDCFTCGEPGHMAKNCPTTLTTKRSPTKPAPNSSNENNLTKEERRKIRRREKRKEKRSGSETGVNITQDTLDTTEDTLNSSSQSWLQDKEIIAVGDEAWVEVQDEKGRTYYANRDTKETCWSLPTPPVDNSLEIADSLDRSYETSKAEIDKLKRELENQKKSHSPEATGKDSKNKSERNSNNTKNNKNRSNKGENNNRNMNNSHSSSTSMNTSMDTSMNTSMNTSKNTNTNSSASNKNTNTNSSTSDIIRSSDNEATTKRNEHNRELTRITLSHNGTSIGSLAIRVNEDINEICSHFVATLIEPSTNSKKQKELFRSVKRQVEAVCVISRKNTVSRLRSGESTSRGTITSTNTNKTSEEIPSVKIPEHKRSVSIGTIEKSKEFESDRKRPKLSKNLSSKDNTLPQPTEKPASGKKEKKPKKTITTPAIQNNSSKTPASNTPPPASKNESLEDNKLGPFSVGNIGLAACIIGIAGIALLRGRK